MPMRPVWILPSPPSPPYPQYPLSPNGFGISGAYSGRSRSPIPGEADHRFRAKPTTLAVWRSSAGVHLWGFSKPNSIQPHPSFLGQSKFIYEVAFRRLMDGAVFLAPTRQAALPGGRAMLWTVRPRRRRCTSSLKRGLYRGGLRPFRRRSRTGRCRPGMRPARRLRLPCTGRRRRRV